MGLIGYLLMAVVSIAIVRRVFFPISLRASIALTLLPLLFTLRAFVTGGIYAPIDLAYQTEPLISYLDAFGIHTFHNSTLSDIYAQMIPWRAVVREAFFSGEWPLINPYMLSGDLLAGSAQPAPYDFLNLVGLAVPLMDSINLTAALAFLWAAIGAFLLAQRFELNEISALFAAAGWMASSFIVFFIESALGHAMLLLPLVCCAAIDVVRRTSLSTVIFLAFILTWVILAGHPEALVQVVVIGSVFGFYELSRRPEGRAQAIGGAFASGILAVLLSAVFLLPVLDALPQTMEYTSRVREGSEELQTMSWKFALQRLPENFVPFVYGVPWKEWGNAPPLVTPHNAAIGGVFLALAVAGAALSRKRERLFLLIIGALGLFAGIGFPPLVRFFTRVPLLSLARNERFIAATILVCVLLAAMGVEICVAGATRLVGRTVLIAAAALLLLSLSLVPVMRAASLSDVFIRSSIASLVVPALLSGAVLRVVRRVDVAIAILLLLALIQRAGDVGGMYPTLSRTSFYREPKVLKKIGAEGLYRFAAEGYALLPNIAAHYRVEDVRGFQAMSLQRLQETFPLWSVPQRNWFNRIDSLASPFLSFLNVRYALHDPEQPLPANWHIIATCGRVDLVENTAVLPRAFIPGSVQVENAGSLDAMRTATDFSAVSWINDAQTSGNRNGAGRVSIARAGLAGYTLRADILSEAWVVISQPAWKGWRAFEGHNEIPVRIANHAFLAIHVPRGRHDLRLTFRPYSFVIGRAITFVTLASLALGSLWSARSS